MKTKTWEIKLTAGGKETTVLIKHYTAEEALALAAAQLERIAA